MSTVMVLSIWVRNLLNLLKINRINSETLTTYILVVKITLDRSESVLKQHKKRETPEATDHVYSQILMN